MKHILFSENCNYKIAILIKETALNKQKILDNYINKYGLDVNDVYALSLYYETPKKISAKKGKEYLEQVAKTINHLDTKILYVADSSYFKFITKAKKVEPLYGYSIEGKLEGFENCKTLIGINYQALIYKPDLETKIELTINAVKTTLTTGSASIGSDIIKYANYPEAYKDIKKALNKLHEHPLLTCDIETFSLKFHEAGIATIAFAWSKHEGIAFKCDFRDQEFFLNSTIRVLIKEFFETYKGKLIFHNQNFDCKVLLYTLYMKHLKDIKGLLKGLEVFNVYERFEDTKIISYLATNSCAGNNLKLKHLAHEFAGNYAQDDINDIKKIPEPELLEYNLVDALSTMYVYEKQYPIMIQDQQETVYKDIFKPSIKNIMQIELTGMALDMAEVKDTKAQLEKIKNDCLDKILNHRFTKEALQVIRTKQCATKNAKLKTKVVTLDDFQDVEFNVGSPKQLQVLLYECMGFKPIDFTDTKEPATGIKTLVKLINHTKVDDEKDLIKNIIDYTKVEKLLTAFIPAFENAVYCPLSKCHYLFGNFNIGATVSGRLSSSNVNLQQIPSNSTYAKLIKKCFIAPYGSVFGGADFSSLEDRISALLTKDSNKLKVYTQKFDGHCLRAYYYFKEQMPDIELTVDSINSIDSKYKALRQDSKAPTFLLTYAGTEIGLEKNCGFTSEEAKKIYDSYHELYQESDAYMANILEGASKNGYVSLAFGLRLRTPLLNRTFLNKKSTPYEAQAEARTAGNAAGGQSYGLLNNRAANEFMDRVRASKFKYKIWPAALIHDAIYLYIAQDLECIKWVNDNLIECMEWQELPEIAHDSVKLGAELDIHYINWGNPITLDNRISESDIKSTLVAGAAKYK